MSTELSITLAERVAELRRGNALTQAQVAECLGISQQAYARYEAAQRKIPVDLLPKLAEAFAISVEDLLGVSVTEKKRGPQSQLERRFREIQDLPKKEQRFIIEALDRLLQKAS